MSLTNNNQTVHGKFKFGYNTKHRYPTSIIKETVKQLDDQVNLLYPTGRAWYLPENGVFRKFHKVLNNSILKVRNFAESTINSYFPDNEEFTIEDCEFWENKLGLISSNSLSLQKRREIIYRKIAFPQNIKARQGLLYIQEQIDLYGFNVKIYENIFEDGNGNYYHESTQNLINSATFDIQHGNPTQHGISTQHGVGLFEVIANNIDDEVYSIGGNQNLWATFFIASKSSLFQGGSVPFERKKEFKELILKLKPAQLVAFTLITYQ